MNDKKELYEMTFNQFCENWLNNSKYANKYKNNNKVWEDKKKDLFREWDQVLETRAEIGDIPEIVIRNLISIVGQESVLRTFRGTKEKGLYSWFETQKRIQHRESNINNLRKTV